MSISMYLRPLFLSAICLSMTSSTAPMCLSQALGPFGEEAVMIDNSGNGYRITISSISFNNTGAVSGLIDKLELTFTGSNMTTVQQRNILRNSVSVPVGSSTVNSFNNPDMYTTSTSSIYGGMTLAAYNGTKQICINTTSFSGSVAASGSF